LAGSTFSGAGSCTWATVRTTLHGALPLRGSSVPCSMPHHSHRQPAHTRTHRLMAGHSLGYRARFFAWMGIAQFSASIMSLPDAQQVRHQARTGRPSRSSPGSTTAIFSDRHQSHLSVARVSGCRIIGPRQRDTSSFARTGYYRQRQWKFRIVPIPHVTIYQMRGWK